MINKFKIGDKKSYTIVVSSKDSARFPSGEVHPVYSTFALARDAEWCCRLFVLEMKEEHEEGIGTQVSVEHQSPALIGQEVSFEATLTELRGNNIICDYTAKVGERIVALGTQGQKIVPKDKLKQRFESLK